MILFKQKYLILILLIGFLLRFLGIGQVPPALNWDEVSHGYNAYSILKTGQDEWGVLLPTIFRAYGDYKLPVYIYLTVISQIILGVNELSTRLVSVLAGTFSVLFTYLLVKELFSENKDKERISLISALLMTIEPWSMFLSSFC